MTWHYTGDLHIENGGTFYNLKNWDWGYAEFVRCTPCSDAGAADNCYWIDRGTVNFDFKNPVWVKGSFCAALDCYGQTIEDWRKQSEATQRHMAFEVLLSYGLYEADHTETVELGPYFYGEKLWNGDDPVETKKLRGNASLRRYVRRVCNEGFS